MSDPYRGKYNTDLTDYYAKVLSECDDPDCDHHTPPPTREPIRLTAEAEFAGLLAEHWQWEGTVQPQCQCGEPMPNIDASQITVAHRAHVASVLASSPTVAALIDRVERAEREQDRLDGELSLARGTFELMRDELAALRAAVKGLADEWEGIETWPNEQGVFEQCAAQVRAVLAPEDEGADDGQ